LAERRSKGGGRIRPSRQGINVMNAFKVSAISAALAFAASLAAGGAFAAESTINVSLWDKGPESAMMDEMHPRGMGMGKMSDLAMAMMGITPDKTEVPAGKVTFAVSNDSKNIEHEMVLAPIASADVTMPYNADENRVDEDMAGSLGEVEELEPGKSGTLTIDLKPGLYVIYCNIPGHFIGGMWSVITVTE
jgi:uncharacterized cupredoxin-like copper-binding protein